MKLYHIVAVAQNGVIGKDNRLPWHFSSDLKHFKNITMGSTLIMGRKTFESIRQKPLPGRENFVLSHSRQRGQARSDVPVPFVSVSGAKFFTSLEDALKTVTTQKVFIIGGETLFKETINQVDGIYLTRIHVPYEGDVFYPPIPPSFKEKSKTKLQDNPLVETIFYEKDKK